MYRTILDHFSTYHVLLPSTDNSAELIAVGKTFVAYDETLPLAKQSPFLSDIQRLLQQCVPFHKEFKTSEAQRTIASETAKRLDERAKIVVRKLYRLFNLEFMETPEFAEAWGFRVKQNTGNILMPQTRIERLTLLDSYIAQEESRPPEVRFTTPDLAGIICLRDDLKANLDVCRSSRSRRIGSQVSRSVALKKLYECLRVAGSVIIIKHFDHAISLGMENWGYVVIKRHRQETRGAETTVSNGTETPPSVDTATNDRMDRDGADRVE
ncbi:MAG: hypothetical protein KDJ52_01360 [Anaerolineae bacterium]|nr:hypothetical protein [Anaerolineae bacterium]